jgi:hypothetical protein
MAAKLDTALGMLDGIISGAVPATALACKGDRKARGAEKPKGKGVSVSPSCMMGRHDA